MTGSFDRPAIVLFAHGSRDPQWAAPMQALQAAVQRHAGPGRAVRVAYLERMAPTLAEVLDELAASGHGRIDLVPVFWAAGGHVLQDLPALIDSARGRYPALDVRVQPALSGWPGIMDWLARQIVGEDPATAPCRG